MRRIVGYPVLWLVIAVPVSFLIFTQSSRPTVLASHDAVVRPSLDGYATLGLGPYLPDFRYPTGHRLGARIDLGKTNADSYQTLIERYAFIASQPEGQVAKLRSTLTDMAIDSAVTGGLLALAGPGLWLLMGHRRRTELLRHVTARRSAAVAATVAVGALAITQPWINTVPAVQESTSWEPITDALPDVRIPSEARPIEVEGGLMTSGTQRLAESALESYRRSLTFYKELAVGAAALSAELHQPADDEVTGLVVSDRHDNVGMDPVARAIGDAGGASFLLDAGDDTSSGQPWEAFSLDSLDKATEGYSNRFAIAGNHDNGDFVTTYLARLGFTTLTGEVVDGPEGTRLLGVNDPRSSGLGSWRDEVGISFDEQRNRIADLACERDSDGDRISTLLVHDANSGIAALERGCVDLVVGGHVHVQLGPTRVIGENGKAGYTYSNGTTGGAAYALAIGTKLRRDAMVTLVTYRDGRPVGIQPVTICTIGDFRVGEYTELDLSEVDLDSTTASR